MIKREDVVTAIEANDSLFDSGDCGDLIRSASEINDSIVAYGVVTYDGELAHIIGCLDGQYFDGHGYRDIDEIRADWAFDRSVEEVEIVEVKLIDNEYVYNGQTLTANIIKF